MKGAGSSRTSSRTSLSVRYGNRGHPAEHEINNNREPIKTAGKSDLKNDPRYCSDPDYDRESPGPRPALKLIEQRRIGPGDHEIDRRMIKPTQQPFQRRRWRHIVSERKAKHRKEA